MGVCNTEGLRLRVGREMTEGLWEGGDGGKGWEVGIALGVSSLSREDGCWKGAEWGQGFAKERKSRRVPGSRQGEGPRLASLRRFLLPGEWGLFLAPAWSH